MATALNSMGVIRWFVGSVTAVISGLPAATAIAVLGTLGAVPNPWAELVSLGFMFQADIHTSAG